jgi:hypothetical protein
MPSNPSNSLPLLQSLSQKKRTARTISEATKIRISFPVRLQPELVAGFATTFMSSASSTVMTLSNAGLVSPLNVL